MSKYIDINKNSKEVFEYCVSVNWNIDKMIVYAKNNNSTYTDIYKSALEYVKSIGKESEYQKIFEDLKQKYLKLRTLVINKPNPLLLEKGITTYFLWRNNEEKEAFLKYIYNLWENSNFTKKDIALLLGISSNEKITKLIYMYAHDYLKMRDRDFEGVNELVVSKNYKRNDHGSKVYDVLKSLLNLKDVNEIADKISSSGYTPDYLRASIHDYLIKQEREHYDEYSALLKNVFDLYYEYRSKQRKDKRDREKDEQLKKYYEEMIPRAIKLITLFIDSDCDSINEFIEKNMIVDNEILNNKKTFHECLEIVKKYDVPLYEKYKIKTESNRSQNYILLTNSIKKIISLIKNGCDENGIIRPFDVIDYFQILNLSFETTRKIAIDMVNRKMLDNSDYVLFVRFIKSNQDADYTKQNVIKAIMQERQEINCEKNSLGRPIPGTGEIISDETKMKLIEYLKGRKIPLNSRTYSLALYRFKNNLLELEEKKY